MLFSMKECKKYHQWLEEINLVSGKESACQKSNWEKLLPMYKKGLTPIESYTLIIRNEK